MNEIKAKGHSEEYFGDYRDYWYNFDFLELMAKRWELTNVKNLLDVGCGQCHWTRVISSFLEKGSFVTAVDSDSKWSRENARLSEFFAEKDISFQIKEADIKKLPFENDSFDAVTCQTVLIHIQNPLEALREMRRVLKPNGILICAEPNNIIASVLKNSLTASYNIEEIIERFTFGLVKEKGKINLGLGDNSLGDLIPELFSQLKLKDIQSYISDKTNFVIPPYQSKEMQAMISLKLENKYKEFAESETKVQFATFGNKYDSVLQSVNEKKNSYHSELTGALDEQTYFDGGGALMYLVSGRK
jgi:ubiquinone/menaquinone biosynthesis C-methylase UbiE